MNTITCIAVKSPLLNIPYSFTGYIMLIIKNANGVDLYQTQSGTRFKIKHQEGQRSG